MENLIAGEDLMAKDIRVNTDFPDHPKTVRLRRALGSEGPDCLLRLWCYAANNRTKGVLSNMDIDDIEIAAKWEGENGRFVEVLTHEKIKFLELIDGVYVLHDWEEHQGFIYHSEERSAKAKRAAKARWDTEAEETEDFSNAGSMQGACGTHKKSMQDASKNDAKTPKSDAPNPFPSPTPSPTPKKLKDKDKEKEIAREKTENLESLNLPPNPVPPPALVGNPFVESYSPPVWLRKVFGELYEEATGQFVICSGIEIAKAKEFFSVLSQLNPGADEKEIYERAKLGAEIAFEGYMEGTGFFHWLDKSPPEVGWFANNAPQVNLAVTARLNMTEEEIEQERETREVYERIKNFADEVDAQVEKDLAEGRKPLSSGFGLPKPRTEH